MSFGSGFLRYPDLFPGRRSGEPWGDRAVALEVAGGPYLFAGLSAAQEEAVRRKFAGLCREAGDGAAVSSRVFRAPAADFLERDVRGWEYTLDMEHDAGSVRLAGLRLMARLDWAPALSGGLWTCEAAGEEWTSVFENFFRVLAAYRLLAEGGAVLHSAGVTDGAAAWLLLGPSGAGKTTASRLCLERGATVLSDDLNAVRLRSAGPHLEKLPFTGDLGERAGGPAGPPLRAVLRLAKGTEERLRPLSPAAALAGLVAAAPFVNRDPWRREALLASLERLARSVPAYELTFSLGGGLWDILKSIPT
ncbi:MAG TPA: hypothetical protein VGG03_21255 [Thermoanaerobaculia bacterium]|jgi:hypothetical protein